MEFHHLVFCYAKSHHTQHNAIRGWESARSAWQWKSVENKAKSIRQVFTIGYVVFKHLKQKQREREKEQIENSVCVLRHQPPPIWSMCENCFYFYLFPYGGKALPDSHAYGIRLSIIWVISFRFKCVCTRAYKNKTMDDIFPSVKMKRSKCVCIYTFMCVAWFCVVCVRVCHFFSVFVFAIS